MAVRLNFSLPWISDNSYWLLAVRDTGQDMDEATRTWLFDPFVTTGDVRQRTSVGPAVLYGILKKHDGSIEV